jgi:hypothetical protein
MIFRRDRDGDGELGLRRDGATPDMALRWTAAGMMEAAKGFRRLKAYKQLPVLKRALLPHQSTHMIRNRLYRSPTSDVWLNFKHGLADSDDVGLHARTPICRGGAAV